MDEWSDMPYVPRYVSPNLIIVPTTSFVQNELKTSSENIVSSESVKPQYVGPISVQTKYVEPLNVETRSVEPLSNPNLVQIVPDVKSNTNAPASLELEGKTLEKQIVLQTLEQNNNAALKPEGTIIPSGKPTILPLENNNDLIHDGNINPLENKSTLQIIKHEGNSTQSAKKPSDLSMEQNQAISQPKVVQNVKHSAKNIKLMKINSWASNYLQSIGQNRVLPLTNSPAPEKKTMPKTTSTPGKIKVNLLSKEKEANTNPSQSTGFLPRMDTITWFTQFAKSPNININYKTNEPQPKIHITQVQPKSSDSGTDVQDKNVLPNREILENTLHKTDTPINKIPREQDQQSTQNYTPDAAVKYSLQLETLSSGNITKEAQWNKNHYECFYRISTDIKNPQNKHTDTNPETDRDFNMRYTNISSSQKYKHDTKTDYQCIRNNCDFESNKEVRSSMRQQTELNNKSIYYKGKFEATFSKTKGLEHPDNNRKRLELKDNKHSDNKRRKLSRNSQRDNKKLKYCSSDKYAVSNDNPERKHDKRKRVTDSENENNCSEAKKAKRAQEIPQKKKDRQESPSTNCPPKSVIRTTENIPKHPRVQHPVYTSSDEEEEPVYFDLRSKLNNKNAFYPKTVNKFDQRFQKPRDNLRITINRSDDETSNKGETITKNDAEHGKNNPIINQSNNENRNNNLTLEKESIPKQKKKNYKQIKLIINVLCKDNEDSSDSSSSDDSASDQKINTTRSDLSFLDDFNIDEIVNSLTRCPKQNAYPKTNELSKAKNTNVVKNLNKIWSSKKFVQPIIIKQEVKIDNVENEHQSILMAEHSKAPKEQSKVSLATEIQSAFGKAEDKCNKNSNLKNDLLKDKQTINWQINVINNLKQENSVDECPIIDDESNVNIAASLEDSSVLANNENLKQEKPNANSTPTDVVQPKTVLTNTEEYISVPTENLDLKLQSNEETTDNTKESKDLNSSEINKDDIELIDNNIVVIDLTLNEEGNASKICNIKLPDEEYNVCNENEILEIRLPDCEYANIEDYNNLRTEKEHDSPEKSLQSSVYASNGNENYKTGLSNEENVNKKDNKIKTEREYDAQANIDEVNVCNESEVYKIRLPSEECPDEENNNKITNGKESEEINSPPEIHTNLNSEVKACQDFSNEKHTEIKEPNKKTGSEICITKNETLNVCTNEINDCEIKTGQKGVEEKSAEEKNETNLPEKVENQIKTLKSTKENIETTLPEENCTKEKNNNGSERGEQTCSNRKNDNEIKSRKEVCIEEKNDGISASKVVSVDKKTNNNIKTQESQNCIIPKDTVIPTSEKINATQDMKIDEVLQTQIENRIFDYLHKKMTVTSLISQGKFSKVYKCKEVDGEYYALKVTKYSRVSLGIEKEDMIFNFQKDIPKENLNTVFLINGFGLFRSWCFLMEYYPLNLGEALLSKVTPYHIDEVQHLSRQLVSAVMLLRTYNIVHADIKPKHILLDATHQKLKLCGFDQSYYAHSMIDLVPNIGTHVYRAPEVIVGYSASFSIDVWSTAVVMYEMATNKRLFNRGFNNDILFQQLCLSGDMPEDMIDNSMYACNHFRDSYFMRRFGYMGLEIEYLCNFDKTNRIIKEIMKKYNRIWGSTSQLNKSKDVAKIVTLNKLLTKMLVIDPRERIQIEFVRSDPFIYEAFNI